MLHDQNKQSGCFRGSGTKRVIALFICMIGLSVLPALVFAQQAKKQITGTVLDEAGETVIGANIKEKGTINGTITDVDGNFSLNVADNATLQISYIGYTTQEIAIGSQTRLQIVLREDVLGLDEVVVIGYGTARRQDYTGSVGSVKLENSALSLLPNLNVLESLKGNVAGMNVGATNSAGGEPSMLIRGQNSINGSNDPLIILDGVIYMGSLSDINPNDIAGIDVLKDAVSAAAYGSRASNGIISITTKKGRSEKPLITLNISSGVQSWKNRPVMMKGEDWIDLVNARVGYEEGATHWLLPGLAKNHDAGIEYNWLDEITQTGVLQDYQLSVAGAERKTNYYLSASFNDNRGVVTGDEFNRISVMGKVSTAITGWLDIGVDASFSRRDYPSVSASIYDALTLTPYGVMYRDDEGNLEKFPFESSYTNPLWDTKSGTRDKTDVRQNYRMNAYAVIRLPWIDGLSLKTNFLPTQDFVRQGNFYHEGYYVLEGGDAERYSPASLQNLLSRANGELLNSKTYTYVFDNILTYKKTFGKHDVEGTLVATRDYSKYDVEYVTGSDFAENGNTALGLDGLHKAKVQKVDRYINSSKNGNQIGGAERTNIGYLGRVNYGYGGKYYFTGSARRDGASVFGAQKKWGTFLAAGLAWRISGERFMTGIDALNNLKLKASWGQNGNQGINPYATLSQVVNGSSGGLRYQFGNNPGGIYYGLNQSTLGNADLGWESTDAWNIGFESSWLNNRLSVDLDVYFSKTYDQIFDRQIPIMTGFKTIRTSMGQVNNSGGELTVRSVNVDKGDWRWTTSLTFWFNRNRLAHLYGEDLDGDGKEDDDIGNSRFIGKSLGAIYGYKQIGIVQEEDAEYMAATGAVPGNPKYADLDGKDGITADDRTILGYDKENFRLNVGNTLSYKNLELYLLVTGTLGGNNYYLKGNSWAYITTTNRSIDNITYRPYWTPENKSNVYPRVTFAGDGRFQGLQSRSFVRIQDLSLSWSFDQSWVKTAGIDRLKLFVAAKNLATFTNWEGGDPEKGSGVLSSDLPVVSTYSLGFNISF